MRQIPRTITRQVKVLRDPNPTYVSLVEHGAIQESFKVLKTANPKGQDMAINKREETKKDGASSVLTIGQPGIRKIVFHSSSYEDEAAVKKYLDANGYTDFTITKSDNTFTAQGVGVTDEVFEKNTVKSVNMVKDGSVTGFVGKVAKAVEKTAKTETTEKQERAIKLDWWSMYDSDAETVSKVLKDGMDDGIPPGFQEIMSATAIAIGNTLKDAGSDRSKMIASIGSEFATLVNASADLYAKMIDKATKQTDSVKKFITQFREEVDAMVAIKAKAKPDNEAGNTDEDDSGNGGTNKVPAKGKKADEVVTDPVAPKKDDVQVPAQLDAAAFADLIGTSITKGIADAVKPLTAQLDILGKKVDTVQTIAEDARNKSTKAADEVALVASQAPMKKSVSEQGAHQASDDEKVAKAAEITRKEGVDRFSNVLGMRR